MNDRMSDMDALVDAAVATLIESDALTPTRDGSDLSTIHENDYEYLSRHMLLAVGLPALLERVTDLEDAQSVLLAALDATGTERDSLLERVEAMADAFDEGYEACENGDVAMPFNPYRAALIEAER